jgi:hypothetical protein
VVRDITIRAKATLWIIALLVMCGFWSLFTTTKSGVTVVATAIASTALFLGSILAHEIARSRSETSRIERSRCHAVRVWRGNRFTSDIKRPGDEFAPTIVGPWTSIILGFGFGLGAFGASSTGVGTFAEIAGQLGWLNVILGVFNLLPEVPLDGGHLPRGNRLEDHPQSFASDGQVDSRGPDPRRTDHRLRYQRTRIRHRELHRGQVVL